MSPQIEKSALNLYRYFKTSYRFIINQLKSPVGGLYKLNVINLDDLISSSMAQIFKSLSLQLFEILILLKYRFL